MVAHRDTLLWDIFQRLGAGERLTPAQFIEEINEAGWHLVSNLEEEELPFDPLTSMTETRYTLTVDNQPLDFRGLSAEEFKDDTSVADHHRRRNHSRCVQEVASALGINA